MSRVLLADPDDALAVPIEFLLQRAGHDVLRTGDFKQLPRLIYDEAPDLVLLAAELGGANDAFVICRQICDQPLAPAVLMLSAAARGGDNARAGAAGARGCLHKPFPVRELLDAVNQLIKERD